MPSGEVSKSRVLAGWQDGGEAEALFEADDPILCLDGAFAGVYGHEDKYNRHDDPPGVEMRVVGPVVDGGVDGECQVKQKQGHDDEVEGWMETSVVFEVLFSGHECPWNAIKRR